MINEIIIDLENYIVQTFTEGYYVDKTGNKIPFKIDVTNYAETEDDDAREEISVTFIEKTPDSNVEYITETIQVSLLEPTDEVVIERRDYQTLKHSAGYVSDEDGEFYPFSIEVLSEEGETDVVEIIWDDIRPEGDIEDIENQILEELNED